MQRTILLLTPLVLLLSACSSTVVTEDERALPEDTPPVAMTGEVDLSQSFIAFTGKNSKSTQEGKFTEFTVDLEKEDGVPVSLDVTIDLTSMVTGSQRLTDHLLDPDFFETETWPEATFTSSSITHQEGDLYTVTGTLTMHGESGEEEIPMEITDGYITSTFTIDRTDYGVGEPYDGSMMSIEVEIPMEIKVVFQ